MQVIGHTYPRGTVEYNITLSDDRAFQLEADRDTGHGSTGRVYTITYKVTDKSGNSTLQTATVTVPANQGNGN